MSDFALKGRHVAAMFVTGFSIIIGVNMTLAVSAVKTFPGLEVKNSYVASQTFDDNRMAQEALGWDVSARVEDGVLSLRIGDAAGPVVPEIRQAVLGRATHVQADRDISFVFDGRSHTATVDGLGTGNWNLRLFAVADDGTEFRQRVIVEVTR